MCKSPLSFILSPLKQGSFSAVLLWPFEQSMVGLLELAKDLLFIVDTLNSLWTCPGTLPPDFLDSPADSNPGFPLENQSQTEGLRVELINACHTRGVAPPLPASYVPQTIRTNSY